MIDAHLGDRSRLLGERVDALAAALREAGVSPEAVSRVLESAATATLHALTLELLLEPSASAADAPAPVEAPRPAPPVRLAA